MSSEYDQFQFRFYWGQHGQMFPFVSDWAEVG